MGGGGAVVYDGNVLNRNDLAVVLGRTEFLTESSPEAALPQNVPTPFHRREDHYEVRNLGMHNLQQNYLNHVQECRIGGEGMHLSAYRE